MITRFVHTFLRRFYFVFRGLSYGVRFDRSVQTSVFLGGLFVIVFSYLFWPLREVELLFLTLAFVLVLVTEYQNSAFESALDALHPDVHEGIGRAKDLVAASAFIAGLFALAVVVWIVTSHMVVV